MATGGCQCGAVRFRVQGAPEKVYACHCRECQKQSASAFGLSALFRADAVTVERGAPRRWTRATDSGGTLECWFCPECGTRLWHGAGDVVSVKGGALDVMPEPRAHIWTRRKPPWVILPANAEIWEEEPDD